MSPKIHEDKEKLQPKITCRHYFHFHKGCTVVRCEKCQEMYPVDIRGMERDSK